MFAFVFGQLGAALVENAFAPMVRANACRVW